MNSLKRIFSKRWFRNGIMPLTLISMVVPAFAHANPLTDLLGIGNITYGVISYLAFGLSWIIGTIAGFFVVIETYAIEQVLNMSFGITKSPVVALGFPVSLSATNLIFVAGLIVIVFATILNIKSYGLRSILWKVVVMAVLVNFGLIISGTILSFSDNITLYFINAISPAGENGSITDFATDIAAAFNPQKLVIAGVDHATPADIQKFQDSFKANTTAGDFIKPIIGIVLAIITYMTILIVLGSLLIVLAYRYIVISMLLIGLPIMWASWPFPGLSGHFSSWWHKFLGQAFAPIPIVFFLWLGIMTAQQMNNAQLLIRPITPTGPGTGPAIFSFLGNLIAPSIDSVIQALLLGAIMGAGLIIAGKMGSEFATSGTNAIKAMNGRVKKELTTRAQRGAKRAGQYVKENTQTLQKAAVSLRQNTTGRVGQLAANTSLKIQNLVLAGQGLSKKRAHTEMVGKIYTKDSQGNTVSQGEGVWDSDKHEWKKDDQGDFIEKNTGLGIRGGKLSVDEVKFTHNGHEIAQRLSRAEAEKLGILSGNKAAHLVTIKVDATDRVQDARATTALVAERMEDVKKDLTVQPGERLTKSQKKARQAVAALDEEAEHAGGLASGLAGALKDAAETVVKSSPGGGGGDKKPAAGGKKDDHSGDHH